MNETIQKLKAAIKQQVEETRALKQEKARLKAEKPPNYEVALSSLQFRREHYRLQARALYLAYGFVRGVRYLAIEKAGLPRGMSDWLMRRIVEVLWGTPLYFYREAIRAWVKNPDVETQARLLDVSAQSLSQENRSSLLKLVPRKVSALYYKMAKDRHFVPENAVLERRQEYFSASGQYKLVVTPFTTGQGTWDYTQGLVYRQGSDQPIADVRNNYRHFPYLFVEDHPNGHPYLVCGEDYQGQTVIELDTGARRDFLPKEAAKGHGFCWASYEYNRENQLLVVEGCYWACPYEYRFYDFSDPMGVGWPELVNSRCVDRDAWKPSFEEDGTIKTYQTVPASSGDSEDDDYDDEEGDPLARTVASTTSFRREGAALTFVEEWVSETEQKRRDEREKSEQEFKESWALFEATDPLYLAYTELVKDPALSPDSYYSRGVTYEGWCPDLKLDETRLCRRIIQQKGLTIDFEWAIKTGPVKLDIFRNGSRSETKFFMDHSVESIQAAFAYAKEALNV